MQIKGALFNITMKAISESLTVEMMVMLAKMLDDNYDVYKRSGFPENIPMPRQDAANQILRDMREWQLFPHYIALLIQITYDGYMGRTYPVTYLKEMIKELYDLGLIYDRDNKIFVEDPSKRRTRNWGTLREKEDYVFSFLRMDIVGNTELVRKYPDNLIKATYTDLLGIVSAAIDKRNGRIWSWEGDGGLIAFYFSNKSQLSTLSGMEIIHELMIYNRLRCRLDEPIKARLAIHQGSCQYTENMEDIKKNDVIKKVIEVESKYTKPNTLTITGPVMISLDSVLAERFKQIQGQDVTRYYNYQLNWED